MRFLKRISIISFIVVFFSCSNSYADKYHWGYTEEEKELLVELDEIKDDLDDIYNIIVDPEITFRVEKKAVMKFFYMIRYPRNDDFYKQYDKKYNDFILKQTYNKDFDIKVEAIQALGLIEDINNIKRVYNFYDSKNKYLYDAALNSLAYYSDNKELMDNSGFKEKVLKAFRNVENAEFRFELLKLIYEKVYKDQVFFIPTSDLLNCLNSYNGKVKTNATMILTFRDDPEIGFSFLETYGKSNFGIMVGKYIKEKKVITPEILKKILNSEDDLLFRFNVVKLVHEIIVQSEYSQSDKTEFKKILASRVEDQDIKIALIAKEYEKKLKNNRYDYSEQIARYLKAIDIERKDISELDSSFSYLVPFAIERFRNNYSIDILKKILKIDRKQGISLLKKLLSQPLVSHKKKMYLGVLDEDARAEISESMRNSESKSNTKQNKNWFIDQKLIMNNYVLTLNNIFENDTIKYFTDIIIRKRISGYKNYNLNFQIDKDILNVEFNKEIIPIGYFKKITKPVKYSIPVSLVISDKDNDSLKDMYESLIFTDPDNPDTDSDGINDGEDWAPLCKYKKTPQTAKNDTTLLIETIINDKLKEIQAYIKSKNIPVAFTVPSFIKIEELNLHQYDFKIIVQHSNRFNRSRTDLCNFYINSNEARIIIDLVGYIYIKEANQWKLYETKRLGIR